MATKRPASTRTIDTFFSKSQKPESQSCSDASSSAKDFIPSASISNITGRLENVPSTSRSANTTHSNEPCCKPHFASDIGSYVNQHDIDDFTKVDLLKNHWQPPPNYIFPHNVVMKNGKERKKYAQKSHLEKFPWLVLSHKDQGLYCKYCVLFASSSGGGYQTNTSLKRLVREPLKKFDDLLGENGALSVHQRNQYHQKAVEAGKYFLQTFHNPASEVVNQVYVQRYAQVKENRERLRPIIKTIIFCGRQNISLRGHRDDGSLLDRTDGGDSLVANDGNFRALLRFRIDSGDSSLQQHLETAGANATYISKTTQNQLVEACKEEIQQVILNRVRAAKFFSVIFDETTDNSHTEQLSLSLRYVWNRVAREDFVTFCDAYSAIRSEDVEGNERRLTGVAVAHIVIDLCNKFDLDLQYLVGIGTDSCSVMASDLKGACHELMKVAIHARRCPCNNHVLNNSLLKSSNVTNCRNASGTMKTIVAFSNASSKRHGVFENKLRKKSLQSLCETRWVENHVGHLQFQGERLIKICEALEEISSWRDEKSASSAANLLHALLNPTFLISTACLNDVLGVTLPLSRILQKPSLDLKKATDLIADTLVILETKRSEADSVFQQLYTETENLAKQLDVEMKVPRVVSRQKHRDNHQQNQTPEEYFRRGIFIPLLDNVVTDLNERLSTDVMNLFRLRVFLPQTSYTVGDIEDVRHAAETYQKLLQTPVSGVIAEFELWVAKWTRNVKNGGELPDSLPLVCAACDEEIYPSIWKLLDILHTLPVTAATAERSFSTLRRLKTWLRSTMAEDRLTGLALLHIHRDIELDIDAIINRFAKQNRKLDFVL